MPTAVPAVTIASIEDLSDVVTAVANRAVKWGAERTSSGNYILDHSDFADLISEEDFQKYFAFILHEIQARGEVLDVIPDQDSLELDIDFALNYCPHYEWADGDESTFNCSYEDWLRTPVKPVSQLQSLHQKAMNA